MKLSTFNGSKRVLDLLAIALSAPFAGLVGAAIGLLVKGHLGSPVFFTQRRVGLNEMEFDVLKFRTMTQALDAEGRLLPDADRLTEFGRFLRATSLDELPQLINVARGDMSLVGPRPLFVRYLPHYTCEERVRHLVRPGITGLAQTSGRNGVEWDERLAHDVAYVRKASLLLDLKILVSTALQVLRRDGVSVLASESGEPLDTVRTYPSDELMTLRGLRADDLSVRVKWILDPRVSEHMQWGEGITEDSTLNWYTAARRDPNRVDYVGVSQEEIVAMAGLKRTDSATAELYVMVDPERHGAGWGKRITALVLRHAHAALGVHTVTLTVARANIAAVRIYQGLGFEITSEDRERLCMSVRPSDFL